MRNRLSPAGAGCLLVIVLAVAVSGLFIPGASAESSGVEEFNAILSSGGGGTVHTDLPAPLVIPDTVADTTFLNGGYYDKNGCPIGMIVGGKEAPHLRDPGFTSGAQCRGACGPDCPTGRCQNLPEIAIENREKTGTCWYTGVIACPSDKGCQDHDSCYDWCESNGHTFMLDPCHLQCNERCFARYGYATCSKWADLPGRTGKYATKTFDTLFAPSYGSSTLKFSNPPDFRENPITLTPTTVVQTTPAVVPTTTSLPPAVATTVPAVPSTTTVTTKPASGETVKLTLIWTGTSKGDGVNVEPQSSGSCDRSGGGFQCSGTFERGTQVTLTAVPNPGSRFNGWFRGCSGTGACTLTMDKDRTVEAQFDLIPVTTAYVNYQEYCTANYPGSVYDRDEQACVFHRGTETPTPGYATSGGLTLIPLAGACCPNEYCETQIATASGGSPPYSFTSSSLAAGSAPPMGMTIDINGVLKGKAPSVLGPYTLGVCVKDLSGQSTCGQATMMVS